MKFEELKNATYCKTMASFRDILRYYDENAMIYPKFLISKELFEIYCSQFNDESRHIKMIELSKTNIITLDGARCVVEKDEKFISEQKVREVIDKVIPLDENCAANMILNNELKKELELE